MLLQDSQKRAAAAAAAAAAAPGSSGPQTVTETRRFAGKDIQVCLHLMHAAYTNTQPGLIWSFKQGVNV